MTNTPKQQEKEWRAQDDARTLVTAKIIQGDPSRLKAAAIQAKKMAAEAKQQATAMEKIANTSKTKRASKKTAKK